MLLLSLFSVCCFCWFYSLMAFALSLTFISMNFHCPFYWKRVYDYEYMCVWVRLYGRIVSLFNLKCFVVVVTSTREWCHFTRVVVCLCEIRYSLSWTLLIRFDLLFFALCGFLCVCVYCRTFLGGFFVCSHHRIYTRPYALTHTSRTRWYPDPVVL